MKTNNIAKLKKELAKIKSSLKVVESIKFDDVATKTKKRKKAVAKKAKA